MVKPIRDRQRARQLALLAALLAAEAALLSQGPLDAWQVSTTVVARAVSPVAQLELPAVGIGLAVCALYLLMFRRPACGSSSSLVATPLRIRWQSTDSFKHLHNTLLRCQRLGGSRSR